MATNELQTKLNEILEDKNTNLLPENLKKDITCLGITGTFEGSGSSHEKVKIFNTVDEMNASTDNQDGDIALIYGINPVEPNTTGFTANTLILSEELPADITIPIDALEKAEGNYSIAFTNNQYSGSTSTEITTDDTEIDLMTSISDDGMMSYGQILYSRNNSSNKWRRGTGTNIVRINGIASRSNYEITKLKVSDTTLNIWNYIKFANIKYVEVYVYGSTLNKWYTAKSDLSTSQIPKGLTMLGGSGLVTGTLDLTASQKILSLPSIKVANLLTDVQNNYSDGAYTGDKLYYDNLSFPYYTTPITNMESFGDKRYLYISLYGGPSGENGEHFLVFDNPDTKITITYNTSNSNFTISSESTKYYFEGTNSSTSLAYLGGVTPSTLSSNKPYTQLKTYSSDYSYSTIIYTDSLYNYDNELSYIATNCDIVDENSNIIIPAGPKASTTLKGQYYTNIFGEKVEGTKEVSEGGVKLFSTYDELTKSENNKENDLAIVYNTETSNITTDDKTYYITFPKTVTLPSAFTSDTNSYFNLKSYNSTDDETNQFSGSGYLSKTKFRVEMSEQTDIEAGQESKVVEYTSTDGLTYTRTTFNVSTLLNHEDMAVMGRYIKIITSDETFDTNLGYFMQIEKGPFKGLYMYRTSHWNLAPTQLNLELGTQLLKGYTGYGEGVVEGTYEPAPITSAEYDTAVTTATEIKGGE